MAKTPTMPASVVTLEQLAALMVPGQRLLGLDVGSKTIGLALSDVSRTIASAHSTIERRKFADDMQRLFALAADQPATFSNRRQEGCNVLRRHTGCGYFLFVSHDYLNIAGGRSPWMHVISTLKPHVQASSGRLSVHCPRRRRLFGVSRCAWVASWPRGQL